MKNTNESGRQQEGQQDSGSRENTSNNMDRSVRTGNGTTDMDPQESIASAGISQRGSGITTKRNVTGSDYDGQLGGE